MNEQMKYTVDIVLCIDATGSMGPVIEDVKENAIKFYQDLSESMADKNKAIDHLRLKVIVYRDFFADGKASFKESTFFSLPTQSTEFSQFVSYIQADGGGDIPESGLEAVAVAIQSPWNKEGNKRRQVIVVWTDAPAHELEKGAREKPENYPVGIPTNFDDLTDRWEGQEYVSASGKRLILYAPDAYPWTNIANNWNNSIHYASQAGHGLSEVEYKTIIDAIANSI
jgi:hypothetical protein